VARGRPVLRGAIGGHFLQEAKGADPVSWTCARLPARGGAAAFAREEASTQRAAATAPARPLPSDLGVCRELRNHAGATLSSRRRDGRCPELGPVRDTTPFVPEAVAGGQAGRRSHLVRSGNDFDGGRIRSDACIAVTASLRRASEVSRKRASRGGARFFEAQLQRSSL
jgi:hypothetical protein